MAETKYQDIGISPHTYIIYFEYADLFLCLKIKGVTVQW